MKPLLILLLLLSFSYSHSQVDLSYYLPETTIYDKAIPTPKDVIGHEVGEWHVSHDKLVRYMEALAETSDRVTLKEYAKTYENRPLIVLTITSPANHGNLDEIKKQHVKLTKPKESNNLNIGDMPAVAYLGYSVHGNEASGSNAALAVAYHLAAAQSQEVLEMLENTVILLDPSFNPDGLNRFAHWVNSRKSQVENTDPYNTEQNETWPGGRTNHYWFDLNRDWLPVQHPESQGRIKIFHEWKPNVLTDHHEMGTNSTYFFQPGIPSRNNPLTPQNTYTLTSKLGEYHAEALDSIGSLYYTSESFDDYYYGKGSTYPDINGAVGILFEQASSRGHAQESVNGVLRFPFTIRNHVKTSFSTLKALQDLRTDFLDHQRKFYKDAANEASKDSFKGYVFGSKDKNSALSLAKLIAQHDIKVYKNSEKTTIGNANYESSESYVVPFEQPQYRLIKAMFEKRTDFQDSLFYDVSTWTLPLAFGVDYKQIDNKSFSKSNLGDEITDKTSLEGAVIGGKSEYAYVFEWLDYKAPMVLNALLSKDIRAKVATEIFYGEEGKEFNRGSILVPVSTQKISSEELFEIVQQLAQKTGVDFYNFKTGLDYKGVSLGSPSFDNIQKPNTAVLVGDGVRGYDAGEVWHLFDQRYEMGITLLSNDVLSYANLGKYNVLILVDGRYGSLDESKKQKIKEWVKEGGTLIVNKRALQFANSLDIAKFTEKKPDKNGLNKNLNYSQIQRYRGAQEIGGAIFEVNIDTTHPLFYGYEKSTFAIFRNSEYFMEPSEKNFANPAVYSQNALLSGYISEENLELLKGSSAVGVSAYGRGRVIGFIDNLNFRAFWYGTNKVFMNAVFFGNLISSRSAR